MSTKSIFRVKIVMEFDAGADDEQVLQAGVELLQQLDVLALVNREPVAGALLLRGDGLEAVALNGAEVHEQIRSAFRRNKTKTFLIVKPLNGTALTLGHFLIP